MMLDGLTRGFITSPVPMSGAGWTDQRIHQGGDEQRIRYNTRRGLAKRRWQDLFHPKNLPQRVLHVRPYMRVENDSSKRDELKLNVSKVELKNIYS